MTNSTVDGLGYEELNQPGSQVANLFMTGSIYTESDISGANVYAKTTLQSDNVLGDTMVSGANVYATGNMQGERVIGDTHISGAKVFSTAEVTGVTFSGTNMYAKTAVQADNVIGDTIVSGANLYAATAVTSPTVKTSGANLQAGSPYTSAGVYYSHLTAEAIISGGMWVVGSGAAAGTPVALPAGASTQSPLGICVATTASGANPNIMVKGLRYMVAEGNVVPGGAIQMGAGAALNTVLAGGAGSATRGSCIVGAGSEGQALIHLW